MKYRKYGRFVHKNLNLQINLNLTCKLFKLQIASAKGRSKVWERFAQYKTGRFRRETTGTVESGVMCCGVVWCDVVWCDVVWCGVVGCGVVWCGVVWCGVVWCGVVWCGVV